MGKTAKQKCEELVSWESERLEKRHKNIKQNNLKKLQRMSRKMCLKDKGYKYYKNKNNYTRKMNKLESAVKQFLKKIKT